MMKIKYICHSTVSGGFLLYYTSSVSYTDTFPSRGRLLFCGLYVVVVDCIAKEGEELLVLAANGDIVN